MRRGAIKLKQTYFLLEIVNHEQMHSLFTVSKVFNILHINPFLTNSIRPPSCFGLSFPWFRSRIFEIVHVESYYPVLFHWEQSSHGKYVAGALLDQLLYLECYLCFIIGFSALSDIAAFNNCKLGECTDENSCNVFKSWKIMLEFPGVPLGDRHVSLKNGLNFQWNF